MHRIINHVNGDFNLQQSSSIILKSQPLQPSYSIKE